MRTKGIRYNAGLNTTMSPEVYKSLLRIFHVEGSVVLSTYDPCGVVQAAAVTLGRHCLTFLGRSTKTALQSIDIEDVPLLRSMNVRARNLHRVVGDHKGNVLTESGAGTTDMRVGPGPSETRGTTGKISGSGARGAGGTTGKRKDSGARETGRAIGKRKGSGSRGTGKTAGKRKASGTRETADTTGKRKGSETRERGGCTGWIADKHRGSGTREKVQTKPLRRDGGASLNAPLKRPESSCAPLDDPSASSRKRPTISATNSSSASLPTEDASSDKVP